MTEKAMDLVFHALAHETRRVILDHLRDRPGQSVGELARRFDVSRIAIMNHLATLETADLVVSVREGRRRRLYLNVAPIQMIKDRWIDDFSGHWAAKVSGLKYAAEAAASKKGENGE